VYSLAKIYSIYVALLQVVLHTDSDKVNTTKSRYTSTARITCRAAQRRQKYQQEASAQDHWRTAPASRAAWKKILKLADLCRHVLAHSTAQVIIQVDIRTVSFNGRLDMVIYLSQPPGLSDGNNSMWTFQKALYGLCQEARAWHLREVRKSRN
jgi:hypothetical protein